MVPVASLRSDRGHAEIAGNTRKAAMALDGATKVGATCGEQLCGRRHVMMMFAEMSVGEEMELARKIVLVSPVAAWFSFGTSRRRFWSGGVWRRGGGDQRRYRGESHETAVGSRRGRTVVVGMRFACCRLRDDMMGRRGRGRLLGWAQITACRKGVLRKT